MSSSVLDGRLPANGVENQDKKLRSKVPRTKIAHIGVSSDKRPAAEAERDNGPLKLRCPFRAHDPDRYKKVHSHCRAEQSFPNIGKLKFVYSACMYYFGTTNDRETVSILDDTILYGTGVLYAKETSPLFLRKISIITSDLTFVTPEFGQGKRR